MFSANLSENEHINRKAVMSSRLLKRCQCNSCSYRLDSFTDNLFLKLRHQFNIIKQYDLIAYALPVIATIYSSPDEVKHVFYRYTE